MTKIIFVTACVINLPLLIGCTTSAKTNSGHKPLKIIDAHLHASFNGKPNQFSGIMKTKESLQKEMQENGVVGAISHTKSYDDNYQDLKDLNTIQCAGISGKFVKVAQLEKGLKENRFQCIKIYLGYVYQYATDPNYESAYKLAEKYKVPVVLHTGDTSEKDALIKYSHPMDIDELAVKHPNMTIVIAHLGNPWVETAAEIVYKNDNVYADISAFLIGDLSKVSESNINEYIVKPVRWAFGFIENPKKLMYGTDWPLADMKSYIQAIKRAIPEESWEDVFYNNARDVFNIPESK